MRGCTTRSSPRRRDEPIIQEKGPPFGGPFLVVDEPFRQNREREESEPGKRSSISPFSAVDASAFRTFSVKPPAQRSTSLAAVGSKPKQPPPNRERDTGRFPGSIGWRELVRYDVGRAAYSRGLNSNSRNRQEQKVEAGHRK